MTDNIPAENRLSGRGQELDIEWYQTQYPDVEISGLTASEHFESLGRLLGRRPNRASDCAPNIAALPEELPNYWLDLPEARLREVLLDSGIFDSEWYLDTYHDVANARADPVTHYIRSGNREGRDPSPKFDTANYLKWARISVRDNINALAHYATVGRLAGYSIGPRADSTLQPNESEAGRAILQRIENRPPIAVIIPVHNAFEALSECLASVQKNTNPDVHLILVDDCSTDPNIAQLITEKSAFFSNVSIIRNTVNRGYSASINIGIRAASESDVVLLNSDTVVTSRWIESLMYVAYSDEAVATVTPMSNSAGPFSISTPRAHEQQNGWTLSDFARLVRQVSSKSKLRAPTGHGFCLYIRRDALNALGLFDEQAFPRGYGEENDFCMRALTNGWSNLIDDSTYIEHVGSASFGSAKAKYLKEGRLIVDSRYPSYTREISRFFSSTEFLKIGRTVESALRSSAAKTQRPRPRILYLISTRTGGTPQTNEDLMSSLDEKIAAYVLRSDSRTMFLYRYEHGVYTLIEQHRLSEPISPMYHRSDEYDLHFVTWLMKYSFEVVHVRHIAWHSLGLTRICKNLGVPVYFSFHDFYAVCPTVKLLDTNRKYCGANCNNASPACEPELWPADSIPFLRDNQIYAWRSNFNRILPDFDGFITTSEHARRLISKVYPSIRAKNFRVIPHGRDFQEFANLSFPRGRGEVTRLVAPGNLSFAKGAGQLLALSEAAEHMNIELHLVGNVCRSLRGLTNVVYHGQYERHEFNELMSQIRPTFGLVLSIWPETYCHTLTELWSCGIPTIGSNLGAVGERIQQTGAGWVIDPNSPSFLNDLHSILNDDSAWLIAHRRTIEWQVRARRTNDCKSMAAEYLQLYTLSE